MKDVKNSKGKTSWAIIRILLFYIVGLMNTVFIRAEDIGSWKNYVGYLFLLLAAIDTALLIKNALKKNRFTDSLDIFI